MKKLLLMFLLLLSFSLSFAESNVKITNEMIYQKLIEIEKQQAVMRAEFNEFKKYVEKRFEMIDKRFEDINRRFEDINRRFEDINRRFEDINKRFEDINKRFEQMMNFLWIITGIFTTLTLGVLGFAYWDRRTIIRKAREETVEYLEREGKLRTLIEILRERAKTDKELAQILRQFNLL